ncbi:MBL fold metallo-hydrolase [Candidatus Dojkabacteria bacterium]|nr:MBL fold metallo-hydrolase [Candidatus Dojkabacteria bacterium]
MFKKSGYPIWRFGGFVQDNEQIGNTEFRAVHAPGHTTGNISLISTHYKTIITGWWIEGKYKPLVGLVQRIADEDRKDYPTTIARIKKPGFKYYYYHPNI